MTHRTIMWRRLQQSISTLETVSTKYLKNYRAYFILFLMVAYFFISFILKQCNCYTFHVSQGDNLPPPIYYPSEIVYSCDNKMFCILIVAVVTLPRKLTKFKELHIFILGWILPRVSYTSVNLIPQTQHVHPFPVFHLSVMTLSSASLLKLDILFIILHFL